MLLVAPFAGAWIEILLATLTQRLQTVAPFAGAWIEILVFLSASISAFVAPFAGAWIEMYGTCPDGAVVVSRTLRGCVD